MTRLALIGGRGYTGSELLTLLEAHPDMELALASSGSQAGLPIREACAAWTGDEVFQALAPDAVAGVDADAWVLAVPNGAAEAWASAIAADHPDSVILDLSADFRFDTSWTYGLPERNRDALRGARRISNPGCYATGTQLGLLPLVGALAAPPAVFGVSGYSGAGKTPSPKNDPERLRDNLIPYSLAHHMHEREVSHQLGRPVHFMPHVASFFRGISLTLDLTLDAPVDRDAIAAAYVAAYADEPLVRVQDDAPEVRDVQGTPRCHLGGFTVSPTDPNRLVLVSVLDNLLKGAACQAMQNLNLALGLDEHAGLEP